MDTTTTTPTTPEITGTQVQVPATTTTPAAVKNEYKYTGEDQIKFGDILIKDGKQKIQYKDLITTLYKFRDNLKINYTTLQNAIRDKTNYDRVKSILKGLHDGHLQNNEYTLSANELSYKSHFKTLGKNIENNTNDESKTHMRYALRKGFGLDNYKDKTDIPISTVTDAAHITFDDNSFEVYYNHIIQVGGAATVVPINNKWNTILNNITDKPNQHTFNTNNMHQPHTTNTNNKQTIDTYFETCENHQREYNKLHNNIINMFNFIVLIINHILKITEIIKIICMHDALENKKTSDTKIAVKIPGNILTQDILGALGTAVTVSNIDAITSVLQDADTKLANYKNSQSSSDPSSAVSSTSAIVPNASTIVPNASTSVPSASNRVSSATDVPTAATALAVPITAATALAVPITADTALAVPIAAAPMDIRDRKNNGMGGGSVIPISSQPAEKFVLSYDNTNKIASLKVPEDKKNYYNKDIELIINSSTSDPQTQTQTQNKYILIHENDNDANNYKEGFEYKTNKEIPIVDIDKFNNLNNANQLLSIKFLVIGLRDKEHSREVFLINKFIEIITSLVKPLNKIDTSQLINESNISDTTIELIESEKQRLDKISLRCYDLQVLYLYKYLEFNMLQSYSQYYLYMLYDNTCIALYTTYLYQILPLDNRFIIEDVKIKEIIKNLNKMVDLQNKIVNNIYKKTHDGGAVTLSAPAPNLLSTSISNKLTISSTSEPSADDTNSKESYDYYKTMASDDDKNKMKDTFEEFSKLPINEKIDIYIKIYESTYIPFITSTYDGHNKSMINTNNPLNPKIIAIHKYFSNFTNKNNFKPQNFNSNEDIKLFNNTEDIQSTTSTPQNTITIETFLKDLPFNFELVKVKSIINDNTYNYQYIIYFLLFNIARKITENNNEIKALDDYNKSTGNTNNEVDVFIKQYIKILQSIDTNNTNTNLYDIVKNILDEAITNKTTRINTELRIKAETTEATRAAEATRLAAAEATRLAAEANKTKRLKEEDDARLTEVARLAEEADAARIAAEKEAAEAASQTPDGIRKKFKNLPLYTENINLITMFYNFYEKYFKEGTDVDAANKVIEQIGNEYKLQVHSQQPTMVNSNKYNEWKNATELCNETMEKIKELNLFNIKVDDTQRDTAVQSIKALIDKITTKITECSTNNIFSMYKAYSSIIAEIVNGAVRVIIKVRNNDDDKNLVEYNSQKKTIKFKDYCDSKKTFEYGPYSDFYDKKSSLSQIYNNLFKNKEAPTQEPKQETTPQTYHNFNAKISAGGTIVLFGYGFSGSGKTYTLIEGSKDTEDTYNQSILNQFIQQHADNINNIEFSEIYPYNAYKNNKNNVALIPQTELLENTNIQDLISAIVNTKNAEGKAIDNKVKGDKIISLIKENITKISAIRIKHLRILQTPNNPESSRSFLQITITLNTGGGKLVIFDMPGSENTVQIKKTMYGIESFQGIQGDGITGLINKTLALLQKSKYLNDFKIAINLLKQDKTSNGADIITKYNDNLIFYFPENEINHTNMIAFKYNHNPVIMRIDDQEQTIIKLLESGLFKNLLVTRTNFVSKCIGKLDIIKIKNNETITSEYIGKCCLDITLFFNRRNSLFENAEPIFRLKDTSITIIVKNFIEKVIFEIEEDKTKAHTYDLLTSKKIDDIDIHNINNIYGITFIKNTESVVSLSLNNNEFQIFKQFMTTPIAHTDGSHIYKYFKIVKKTLPKPEFYEFHLKIDNNKNCISPTIKYFLIFMVSIFKGYIGSTIDKDTYASLLIFVYKYVNFIVEQGKSIVTSLEHLKYFFLANTNQIDIYNNKVNNKEKAMTYNPTAEQKKDIKNKATDTILVNPRTYKIPTNIGDDIMIDEIVNCGQMIKYKLLAQLQTLAHRNTDLITCVQSDSTKLDILKCTALTVPTKSQTLFIMIAHIKEFYDSTNKNTDPQQSQICDATHATLEFSQSVSSSSGITEQASQEPGAQVTQTQADTITNNNIVGGYRDNIIKQKTPSQSTKKHNTNNTHNYNLYTKYNKPYKHKTVKKSLKKDKSLFRFNTKLNKIKYTQ